MREYVLKIRILTAAMLLYIYIYIGLGGGFNERGIVEYKRRDDSGALSLWLYTSHGAQLGGGGGAWGARAPSAFHT